MRLRIPAVSAILDAATAPTRRPTGSLNERGRTGFDGEQAARKSRAGSIRQLETLITANDNLAVAAA